MAIVGTQVSLCTLLVTELMAMMPAIAIVKPAQVCYLGGL